MAAQSKRDILTQALIEQELSSRLWEDLVPDIPVDASPQEALKFARSALEHEYSVIATEDLETLYRIFIMETDVIDTHNKTIDEQILQELQEELIA